MVSAMRPMSLDRPTHLLDQDVDDTVEADVDEAVMHMLAEHVPLSLLCDLTAPEGPRSAEILAEEGEPDTRWWEQ